MGPITQGRGKRTRPEVRTRIRELYLEGNNAAQIQRKLDEEEHWADDVPALRTIQHLVRQMAGPRDTSGDWSVTGADADEARLVLPVLAEVITRTRGRVKRFTRKQGEWIAKLSRIDPNLPAWYVYDLAKAYIAHEDQGADSLVVDHYLAFDKSRPSKWTEGSPYEQAVHNKWIEGFWILHMRPGGGTSLGPVNPPEETSNG
ncbi:MAG: hypothetical protein H0X16_10655 [Chloroflexi bacterium]|nr:hypothetical protein [Chloroflexota bacterium]